MIKYNGIDEFCGLNSIIKLSSSDLAKNGVAIMSRQLERTTSRMVFLVPLHFIINLSHSTFSQTSSNLNFMLKTSFGKERNSKRVLDSRYESHGDGKDQR